MLLSFIALTLAGRDSRQRRFPAKLPNIFFRRREIRLLQAGEMSRLVPLEGVIVVAAFQINASQFIRRTRRVRKLAPLVLQIERAPLIFRSLIDVALEGIGDRHHAQRLNCLLVRRRSEIACPRCCRASSNLALQIERDPRVRAAPRTSRDQLQRALIERHRVVDLSVADQLLTLLHQFQRVGGIGRRWRGLASRVRLGGANEPSNSVARMIRIVFLRVIAPSLLHIEYPVRPARILPRQRAVNPPSISVRRGPNLGG